MVKILLILLFSLINAYGLWKNYLILKQRKKIEQNTRNIKIEKQKQQEIVNAEIRSLEGKKQEIIVDINKLNDLLEQQKGNFKQTLDTYRQNVEHEIYQLKEQLIRAKEKVEIEYQQKLDSLNQELDAAAAQLNKIKATRVAARQALIRQQKIKDNKEDYCLIPSDEDLDDIYKLEKVKKHLFRPRILSMLIWQTYWQPLAKKRFPIILGTKTITGIYKITNLKTNDCYIGQALDMDKRWKQHLKCGLGIDTPAGNKLYKAMLQDGLENFAFELLEECPKQQLNEKEKYYIDLYDAYNYGYNSNTGIKK